MGVAVGYQVQVEHVALYPNVGDVGMPHVVGILGHKPDRQVGILEVHMVGVRSVPRLLLWQHEVMATQQIQE